MALFMRITEERCDWHCCAAARLPAQGLEACTDFGDRYPADPLPEREREILVRPLSMEEMEKIAKDQIGAMNPGCLYVERWMQELEMFMPGCHGTFEKSLRKKSAQRLSVMIRHRIKRYWEKLGIWNSAWGIPGNDDPETWVWPWEEQSSSWASLAPRYEQLVIDVLQRRANLARGEKTPVLWQSTLERGASRSQAEAFLTSRPWYMFNLDIAEEDVRQSRLPEFVEQYKPLSHYLVSPTIVVRKWWDKHGDLRQDDDGLWNWPDEPDADIPPPVALKHGHDGQVEHELAKDLELTPSETDALEAINDGR